MASIKLTGDTSGEITISAPAVAGTNTLTLPASTGTVAQTTTGLIEVDMYRLTSNVTTDTDPLTNLERVDDASFSKIGTGMSESSGIFTFPRTGVYEIKVMATMNPVNDSDNIVLKTLATTNNSSYSEIAFAIGSDASMTAFSQNFVNCTDTSNVKVKFLVNSINAGGNLTGDTNYNATCFSFIRLGDSQ